MPYGVPGGRGGPWKGFMGQYLPLIILKIIKEKNGVHGYEISKIVEDLFESPLPPGMIYMYLRRMESRGLIISQWDYNSSPPRRVYTITTLGESYFETSKRFLGVLKKVLDYLCEEC